MDTQNNQQAAENDHMHSYTSGLIKGVLIGSLVGAVTALLLAPKPGRELREDLKVKAGEASEVVKARAAVLADTASQTAHTIGEQAKLLKDKVQDIATVAKQRVGETAVTAQEALGTVKEKASAVVVGLRAVDSQEEIAAATEDGNAAEKQNGSMAQDEQEMKRLGKEMESMKTNRQLEEDGLVPDPKQS